jgi:hypothetical protein
MKAETLAEAPAATSSRIPATWSSRRVTVIWVVAMPNTIPPNGLGSSAVRRRPSRAGGERGSPAVRTPERQHALPGRTCGRSYIDRRGSKRSRDVAVSTSRRTPRRCTDAGCNALHPVPTRTRLSRISLYRKSSVRSKMRAGFDSKRTSPAGTSSPVRFLFRPQERKMDRPAAGPAAFGREEQRR